MSARILVVEHDPVIATDLYIGIEDLGYEAVGPVSSVRQALEAIAGEPLHGALLDCKLIGETSQAIAEVLHRRDIPFAYVTGNADFRAGQAGWPAAPVLVKPLGQGQLSGTVRHFAVKARRCVA